MILLDKISQRMPEALELLHLADHSPTILRVHSDVLSLAGELVIRDREKLLAAAHTAFFPTELCWFEWEMGPADGPDGEEHAGGLMGVMFAGTPDVRTGNLVYYAWKHGEDAPYVATPASVDLANGLITPDFSNASPVQDPIVGMSAWNRGIAPMILGILCLINSPKMVKRKPSKLEKLNRKREAAGKYTFHPHHTVKLNVDRDSFTVQEGAGGDKATRAHHHVRAHLRLMNGTYVLVKPHWRGDPQVGIRQTSYEIERNGSRWPN